MSYGDYLRLPQLLERADAADRRARRAAVHHPAPDQRIVDEARHPGDPRRLRVDPRRRRPAGVQDARPRRANFRAAQQRVGRPAHDDAERLLRVPRPSRPVVGIPVLAIPRDRVPRRQSQSRDAQAARASARRSSRSSRRSSPSRASIRRRSCCSAGEVFEVGEAAGGRGGGGAARRKRDARWRRGRRSIATPPIIGTSTSSPKS